jgi:hypothetical protein
MHRKTRLCLKSLLAFMKSSCAKSTFQSSSKYQSLGKTITPSHKSFILSFFRAWCPLKWALLNCCANSLDCKKTGRTPITFPPCFRRRRLQLISQHWHHHILTRYFFLANVCPNTVACVRKNSIGSWTWTAKNCYSFHCDCYFILLLAFLLIKQPSITLILLHFR